MELKARHLGTLQTDLDFIYKTNVEINSLKESDYQ